MRPLPVGRPLDEGGARAGRGCPHAAERHRAARTAAVPRLRPIALDCPAVLAAVVRSAHEGRPGLTVGDALARLRLGLRPAAGDRTAGEGQHQRWCREPRAPGRCLAAELVMPATGCCACCSISHFPEMTAPRRANAGKPWTEGDDELLRRLAGMNVHPKLIADQIGRSLVSVLGRATQLGVSVAEGARKRRSEGNEK
jgi:hypothetical protein